MTTRKQRSDSKLKTLPEARQNELWQFLYQHPYKAAIAWCREKLGLDTSAGALSEFYSWYPSSRVIEQAATLADQIKSDLQRLPDLKLDDETIGRAAQVAFESLALRMQDPRTFIGLRKLRQKERELELDSRRIAILENRARQADAAETVVKSELSEEEKRARLKQIFGLE